MLEIAAVADAGVDVMVVAAREAAAEVDVTEVVDEVAREAEVAMLAEEQDAVDGSTSTSMMPARSRHCKMQTLLGQGDGLAGRAGRIFDSLFDALIQ